MISKIIKDINFQFYNQETKKLIKKFEVIWARKFDIDNALKLHWDQENLKILELGCFNWREYSYIAEKNINYLWIDIAKDAVEYAREIYDNDCFIVWDFEKYNFDWTFDIVLAFASLLHSDIETTKVIFKKVYNLLNNRWIFYISMKSSNKYKEVIKRDEFWKRIYYYYSLEEYKKIWWEKFKVIYENEKIFNNEDWFTLAFKK